MNTERKRLKVYVSGASNPQERGRVKVAMLQVKGHPNMELTFDWAAYIEEQAGGVANLNLTDLQRREASSLDVVGVLAADYLWFLAPNFATSGAWFESGVVDGWNFANSSMSDAARGKPRRRIEVFASGNTKQSIFCSRMREFASDMEAFMELQRVADLHSGVR